VGVRKGLRQRGSRRRTEAEPESLCEDVWVLASGGGWWVGVEVAEGLCSDRFEADFKVAFERGREKVEEKRMLNKQNALDLLKSRPKSHVIQAQCQIEDTGTFRRTPQARSTASHRHVPQHAAGLSCYLLSCNHRPP
jgi:hypothetical protein